MKKEIVIDNKTYCIISGLVFEIYNTENFKGLIEVVDEKLIKQVKLLLKYK